MRFRNIKPRTAGITGNTRTAMTGRDVRSRIFAQMDTIRLFQQPDLGERSYPTLRTVGENGEEHVSIQAYRQEPVEWPSEDPKESLSDALPPESGPADVRPGGADRPDTEDIAIRRRYSVTGTTTTRSLDVTSPTVANVARVLNALLGDLADREIVTKVNV